MRYAFNSLFGHINTEKPPNHRALESLMTVVKSSINYKPKLSTRNLKRSKSGIADVFSNSQLASGISRQTQNEEKDFDSFDPMSEEEESQAPK